jgi:hypothetical protein
MQYTLRNVSPQLDAVLRDEARRQGKSLNEAALRALERGTGIDSVPRRRRDLADIAGSWQEDPAFDSAIEAQDSVDPALWP